jgi:hypothetical protein
MSIGADPAGIGRLAGQRRRIVRKARAHGIAPPMSDGPG